MRLPATIDDGPEASSHTRRAGIASERRAFALKGQASQSFKDLIRGRPFPGPALERTGWRGTLTHGTWLPAGRGIVRSDDSKSRNRSGVRSPGKRECSPGEAIPLRTAILPGRPSLRAPLNWLRAQASIGAGDPLGTGRSSLRRRDAARPPRSTYDGTRRGTSILGVGLDDPTRIPRPKSIEAARVSRRRPRPHRDPDTFRGFGILARARSRIADSAYFVRARRKRPIRERSRPPSLPRPTRRALPRPRCAS